MMAILFLFFVVSQLLILRQQKTKAFWIGMANVAFILLMLWHHATDVINIRL